MRFRRVTKLLFAFALALMSLSVSRADPVAGPERVFEDARRQPFSPMGPRGGWHMNPPLLAFLHRVHLTEEQQDKVFNILHAQAPAVRDRMKAARQAHMEMRTLVMSGHYDEAKARAIAQSGAQAMTDLEQIRASGDSQILALLTPEQRKRVDEWSSSGVGPRPGPPGFGPRPR